MDKFMNMKQVAEFFPANEERLFSASHEEILEGATTDVYFVKTAQILSHFGKDDVNVTAEIFSRGNGVLCGIEEARRMLMGSGIEVESLAEGEEFSSKEVVMRLRGAYSKFGIYETALLGMLASSSGWATAARECKKVAGAKSILCFGARHVHPAVAPVMERSAVIGGADGASCILGAKLAGIEPSGTVPHAVILIIGDTLKVAQAYDEIMDAHAARIILVDTFKDEAEETLRVANAMKDRLAGIRLDTPSERGGVTTGMVAEIRARLDQAGFAHVKIFISGGLTPQRIIDLSSAGADAFGVGSFISGASAIDMTMDLKEIEGVPIAKRGRIPGITPNPRLKKLHI